MTVITTTTDNARIRYPGLRRIDTQSKTGHLFHVLPTAAATGYQVYRSTDKGVSWSAFGGTFGTPAGQTIVEMGSLYVDWQNRLYFTFRCNTSSQDRIYLQAAVITTTGPSWHTALLVASAANGGVAGAVFTGSTPAVVRHSDGRTTGFVAVAYQSGAMMGVRAYGFTIPASGQPVLNTAIVAGTRQWQFSEAAGGHQVPSVDFELSPAHMWITWGRTYAYAVKLTWNGAGWAGPTTYTRLSQAGASVPAPPATDSMPAVWRNPGWCVAQPYQFDTTSVVVWERNQANSSTTSRITPTHPAGVVKNCALAIDWPTRNIRVYAVGTSSALLYYVDFVTSSGTWGAWSSTGLTVAGTVPDNYSVRRRDDVTARYDILYLSGTVSPWNINHVTQTAAYAPYTPTWVYSATDPTQPGASGNPMDVGTELHLVWAFSDPDPADTSSAFALSKQVGAGSVAYWRATDSTWVVGAEIKNVSPATQVTLPIGWALDSDASVSFKVKVWDASDAPSSYSDTLYLVPSAQVYPTAVSPANGGSVTSTPIVVSWTAPAGQTGYRVTLTGPSGAVVGDTGYVLDTASSVTFSDYDTANGSHTATIWLRNTEGMWNYTGLTTTAVTFTVTITLPATPTVTVTALPAVGAIRVAITNPTPTGGQPTVLSQTIQRRTSGDTSLASLVTVAPSLAPGSTYDDWTAASGVAYEYRVVSTANNGTSGTSGWTA